MGIMVRAKMLGYYDHKRRREGEEFMISSEQHFSNKWMTRLDAVKNEPAKVDYRESPVEEEGFRGKRRKKYEPPVMVVKEDEEKRGSDEEVL